MKSIWLASVAALVIPAALPAAALAQAATTAAADTADQGEIIVTATRRAEALSDVPIAVSAINAEQLQQSGGTDLRQLNQLAPSLFVSSATNESNAVARIRGIGTVGENPGLESSVALFIDGVYRSRTGVGLTDLGPIERVEVLRGPQGTLFGRNASAGLISITTAMPKFEFGGSGEVTYGNYNNVRVLAGLTGPLLGDKVAFRIDGLYNRRDGFLKDVISGRDLANRDRWLIRGQLLIKPNDDLSIRLIGDYNSKDEECCGAAYLAPIQNVTRDTSGNLVFSPNSIQGIINTINTSRGYTNGIGFQQPAAGDSSAFVRRTSITPGASYNQRTRDWGVSGEVNWELGFGTITSITGYREFRNTAAQDADFNVVDILRRDNQKRKFATFTQELRVQGTLFDDRIDWLVGGYYSNEILRSSDDIVYGRDYEAFVNAQLGGTLPTIAALVGYAPPAGGSLLNGTGIQADGFLRQRSENFAIFTHNVIQIVPDKLLLTLGGRYTDETKRLSGQFRSNNDLCTALRTFGGNYPAALIPAAAGATSLACVINDTAPLTFAANDPGQRRKESEFTGTAVLSFKPTDRVLTYISYSRGYKAGGFNLDSSALDPLCQPAIDAARPAGEPTCAQRAALPANTPGNGRPEASDLQFDQETVDAYEFGFKLDFRRFKLNGAVFYQRFSNFQLNTFNGVNFEVTNINSCKDSLGGRDTDLINNNSACTGKARPGVESKGFELEATFFPVSDLTVNAALTYADTRYQTELTGSRGRSLSSALFQLPGQTLSNASPWTATTAFAWTPQINDRFSGLVYFDARYQSALNTGSDLDFEKRQKDFVVANARIGFYGPDKKWGIEFWGQNIFNELYQQVAADAPLQGSGATNAVVRGLSARSTGIYIAFPSEPRTYGVTIRGKF